MRDWDAARTPEDHEAPALQQGALRILPLDQPECGGLIVLWEDFMKPCFNLVLYRLHYALVRTTKVNRPTGAFSELYELHWKKPENRCCTLLHYLVLSGLVKPPQTYLIYIEAYLAIWRAKCRRGPRLSK